MNAQLLKKMKLTSSGLKLSAVVLTALFVWLCRGTNSSLSLLGVNPDAFCMFDWSHYLLQTENRIIIEYESLQYALQILSSMMIDFAAVHTMTLW